MNHVRFVMAWSAVGLTFYWFGPKAGFIAVLALFVFFHKINSIVRRLGP